MVKQNMKEQILGIEEQIKRLKEKQKKDIEQHSKGDWEISNGFMGSGRCE
ncbi:hypothetical protein RCO48_08335 [Peribacillus frigoritolerans]|nr:hypothetical protein [Peribacillus frigoritolerans]